jgi:hypothetical protein
MLNETNRGEVQTNLLLWISAALHALLGQEIAFPQAMLLQS